MPSEANAQPAAEAAAVPPAQPLPVDLDAHNGLRGVAAVWVCVFHCLLYSQLEVDWQGSSLMPLFFMLSGFSLAVVYGARGAVEVSLCGRPSRCSCCGGSSSRDSAAPRPLPVLPFLQNRLARVVPMYYFSNLLALPPAFFGYGGWPASDLQISLALTFALLTTLATPLTGVLFSPLNGPSWTVVTLLFVWLAFPWLLQWALRLSDEAVGWAILWCWVLQMTWAWVLFGALAPLGSWPAFATATMHPLGRLPLFFMGVLAAVLCLRHPATAGACQAPSLPLPISCCGIVPLPRACCRTRAASSSSSNGGEEQLAAGSWAATADLTAACLLLAMLAVGAGDTALRVLSGRPGALLGSMWLQCCVPYAQLQLLVALTRDGGASATGRALRSPLAQCLGRLSLGLYLCHFPLIAYLAWAVQGGGNAEPSVLQCASVPPAQQPACQGAAAAYAAAQLMPSWGVLVVLPGALLLAWVAGHVVEEPGRRALRAGG